MLLTWGLPIDLLTSFYISISSVPQSRSTAFMILILEKICDSLSYGSAPLKTIMILVYSIPLYLSLKITSLLIRGTSSSYLIPL